MPHPISLLGAIHTLISLPPIIAAVYCLKKYNAIDTSTRMGKLYIMTLALSVLTSFGLSSTGKFNAGHALGILAMVVAFCGQLVPRLSFLGPLRPYLSALGLSFSFFLLLVPGINETLSRLPPSHPVGNGIGSPVVQGALKAWVAIFIIGLAVQMWRIHSTRKSRLA